MENRTYLCIDLKSFYASVECRDRGLNPMTTNLVVADPERTEKTICLAVSPSLKKLGIPGRCRVFELPEGIDYIMAPPRMQRYIDYSARIYGIYLKYIAKEDIHVYSIDEVFMDVTDYLRLYQTTAKELAVRIMADVMEEAGIPAAAGIGTNLYLAKIALDITAKHAEDRIGILDEEGYRKTLWTHKPLTDFWRVGEGTVRRLAQIGIDTMEGIARADEKVLYRLFGVDAELLIDHAWGRETTLLKDIKTYKPKANSLGSGQVLPRDYSYEEGKTIVKEMAELLALELAGKGMVTESITLHVSYTRRVEKKAAHGSITLPGATSSSKKLVAYTARLYEEIVERHMFIRRVNLTFPRVGKEMYRQYDLFTDTEQEEKEIRLQRAVLEVKERYGKNAILRGMNYLPESTTVERNGQIGGHKSGI